MPAPQQSPPESSVELFVRLLHDARVKVGGEKALAEHLSLAPGLIHQWLMGHGHPPDDIIQKCVDLLGRLLTPIEWGEVTDASRRSEP